MDEWTCKDWINELRSNGQVPLANPPQSAHLYIYISILDFGQQKVSKGALS